MSKTTKILIAIVLALVAAMAGAMARINHIRPADFQNSGHGDIAATSDDVGEEEPRIEIAGQFNILIIGEDNVEESRRSDTVLLATIDVDNRTMKVLSLPRDTRVAIPKHGFQKLNHAYAYGHQDLLRATIEKYLGINIHNYVKVDYDSFPYLVDSIGGVDMFVGNAMKYRDVRGKLDINIPAGKQHFDGKQALLYVRFRKDQLGDIGRVRRQQQFIKAFIHKLYEPQNLLNYSSIIEEMSKTVQTDLKPSMIFQLGLMVKSMQHDPDKIFFAMLPGKPAMVDNLSYWLGDVPEAVKFLQSDVATLKSMDEKARASRTTSFGEVSTAADFSPDRDGREKAPAGEASGDSPSDAPGPADIMSVLNKISEPIAVLNGSGKAGVGDKVAKCLQLMGVNVEYIGNAKHFDYRSTNIIYPPNSSSSQVETARMLGKLCGVSSALTRSNKLATYPSLIVGHDFESVVSRLDKSRAEQ